jgi:sterol desaturase/sphingolipid hydroxylase (fatty acid hydroxylase superfamily)
MERSLRRQLPRVLLGAALVATVIINRAPLGLLAVLFVAVVPFEKLWPRHEQRLRRPGVGTDIAYALAGPALGVAGLAVAVVVGVLSLAWIPGLMIRPVVGMLPGTVRALLGLLLFDATTYWAHRWSHEVPFLWRFHAIHHSSDRMDWVSGIRVHPFDGAFLAPAFVFLIGAGFSARFSGALAVVQLVTGLFLHANVRWRWRPLHRVVITPEFHHWHHANEPGAINSNYAAFLPLWDLAFGTYFMPKDRRPQVYGVDERIPASFVAQLRHPLRGLRNPVRVIRHPVVELRILRAGLARGRAQLLQSTLSRRRVERMPA